MAEQTTVPVKSASTKLQRRDPFALFDELQDEMGRIWSGDLFRFWPFTFARPTRRVAVIPSMWTPSMDVFEKNGNLVVKADLPGVKKEDVHVEVDKGDLVIAGESKAESEVKEEDYYRMERSYGSFSRRLPLPTGVDADKVKATFADGVLEVTIPKPVPETPTAKKVEVH